ncbi:MAG: hypothetical protein WC505_01655 [Patescibacteria group bacterium]
MTDAGEQLKEAGDKFPQKETAVTTEQKMGVGVKVLLTIIVIGAVAAGVYAALTLSS